MLAIAASASQAALGAPATRYAVRELGTLGGNGASANSINDIGWASGASNPPGSTATHTVLWLGRLRFDLGTLGGPNSAVDWPVKDTRGQLVGNSDTATSDPLGENFCRYKTGLECRGFLWQNGEMTALATLGGNNSYAAGENNLEQIVGWAETSMHDGTCTPPQQLQYLAAVWQAGQVISLPPYGKDPDGAAVAANDVGQIVGISGPCADADGLGARHAVLWQGGKVRNLGGLGGTIFNTADAINEHGTIVGFADVRGNTTFHAVIWPAGGKIQDLGTLPGDVLSEATGINNGGQVVGGSCNAQNDCRAVLWESGHIIDLNSLVPPLSPLYLTFGGDIADDGTVDGSAYDPSTGTSPGFVAIPRGSHSDLGLDVAPGRVQLPLGMPLPAAVRAALHVRVFSRFGAASARPL